MKSFLKLIRIQNLLIIVFALYMARYCIIKPVLQVYDLKITFTELDMFFVTLAWVMVAAGGYAINDYFDNQIDRINRPDTQVVGKTISRGTATTTHLSLSITGCVLGMLASIRIGEWKLGLMFPFVAGLLWFYSTAYKKQFLLGNLVVAFITGLGLMTPALYEYPGQLSALSAKIIPDNEFTPKLLLNLMLEFGVFAFATTLVREIIKDIEDVEGDKANDCNTIPIALGIRNAKIIAISLTSLIIAGLGVAYFIFFDERELDFDSMATLNKYKAMIYFLVLLIAPLGLLIYKLAKADSKKEFHACSSLMKWIMLAGILFMLILRYDFLC